MFGELQVRCICAMLLVIWLLRIGSRPLSRQLRPELLVQALLLCTHAQVQTTDDPVR